MKRFFCLLPVSIMAAGLWGAPGAQAHDMWLTADSPQAGQPLTAIIGYGHNFPQWEAIPEEEIGLFPPVKVVGPQGELTMKTSSPNYAWVSSEPLAPGGYLLSVDVKPVFWTKTPAGWAMKPKNETQNGLECGHYVESAKGILQIGENGDASVISKPVGLPLEITPKVSPASIKSGGKMPLQVLFQGQPLPGAKVEGRFAGLAEMASPGALAFSDVTDKNGEVAFVPLRAGDWILTVRNVKPFKDAKRCDKEDYGASLFFKITD